MEMIPSARSLVRTSKGKHVPRAVFVDLEPTVVGEFEFEFEFFFFIHMKKTIH